MTIRPSRRALPADRNSSPSKQGERYVPSVSQCYKPTVTRHRSCAQRFVTRCLVLGARAGEDARDVPVVPRRGVRGETLPPAWLPPCSPRGSWCSSGAMPGCQARMSGSPPQRRSMRSSHLCLTALPGTPPAGHWPWSVVGRAFGACCFAGKLRSPAPPAGRPGALGSWWPATPYVIPYVNPHVIPYARGVRTPSPAGRRITAGHAPAGGQSAAKTAADWPPSGGVERPRRKERFARLIQRHVRVLGGPSARAAFGGNLSRTW